MNLHAEGGLGDKTGLGRRTKVSGLELNRNPENYFAEIEQAAFSMME